MKSPVTGLCAALALAVAGATIMPTTASAAITQEQDGAAKINLSGRQRMLTQRIAASACFATLGVQLEDQMAVLVDASTLYASTLDGLQFGNEEMGMLPEQDSNVLAEIQATRDIWADFSKHIEMTSSEDMNSTLVLMELSVPILIQSDKVVKALVASRGKSDASAKLGQTIDLAGRQRMLSQRMAKAACAAVGGMFPSSSIAELAQAKAEFEQALVQLEGGSDSVLAPPSAAIEAQLAVVREIWTEVSGLLQSVTDGNLLNQDELSVIAARSTDLLVEMNKAVGMYGT